MITVQEHLIAEDQVAIIDFSHAEKGEVSVTTKAGQTYHANEFEAFRIICQYSDRMEGRRFRWAKHAWAFHNLVGHPAMQILVWLGMTKLGLRVHDATAPKVQSYRT